jgi:tetratricopeptide (TPR) repeat protein
LATKKTKFKDLIKRKSQLDQEIEQYERLVFNSPNEARYQLKLGDLYLEKEERKKGIEQLVKAANSFNESGFYLKSIAIYKKILRLGKGSIDIYLKLGGLYQKNGLLGDALGQYKKVLNLSKNIGKLDKAIEILRCNYRVA